MQKRLLRQAFFAWLPPSASHSLGRFPLLSLCDIFPRPGEVGPQGDAFELCRKLLRYRQKPSPLGKVASRSDDERGILRLHFYVLHKRRILSM